MSSFPPPLPSRSTLGATGPTPPGVAGPRPRRFLDREPVGGALLLAATVVALLWANSPVADSCTAVRDASFSPEALHLHLSVGAWAADGLLAVFFFVVGLELKHEIVLGDLRDPRRALVPVAVAVGGVVVPAAVFLLVTATAGGTPPAGGPCRRRPTSPSPSR